MLLTVSLKFFALSGGFRDYLEVFMKIVIEVNDVMKAEIIRR